MANTNLTKARGLSTFSNYLDLPEGSLLKAKNVNIDRDGIIEPRRGFGQYGQLTDKAKQLLSYKNRILAHNDSKISWDNSSGTFTDFTGSYAEIESGLRLKYIELNGNLFLTSSEGIRKISATSSTTLGSATESLAGPISAVDIYASLNYASAGFLLEYSKVAYRVVWGKKDNNSNLVLGAPSERFEVTNSAAVSCNVDLEISVPYGVDATYFYQVYRTNVAQIVLPSATPLTALGEISSGDEMNLVYEAAYDGMSSTVTFLDITPEDFRDGGTPLYTNATSGEGILQSNYRPPFAKDISTYKNTAFYGNTRNFQKSELALLGTSALTNLSVTSISGSPTVTVQTTVNHELATGDYVVVKGSNGASSDGTFQVTFINATTFTYTGDATGATAGTTSVFTSYVILNRGVTTERYFFVGRPEIWELDFTGAIAGTNINAGDYFSLYSLDDEKHYVVWYTVAGVGTEPIVSGAVYIPVDVLVADTAAQIATKTADAIFNNSFDFLVSTLTNVLTVSTATSGPATNPTIDLGLTTVTITNVQDGFGEEPSNNYIRLSSLESPSQKIEDTARSMTRVINNQSNLATARYTSSTTDTPGKMTLEDISLNSTPFSIFSNNDAVGALFNPDLSTGTESSNDTNPNRIYFSKYSQPEHVPLVNYIDVGPKDKEIIRIIGLRDSLFILKEEGIYRLSGDDSNNFSVTLFDNSVVLTAPDSVAILNNQIYALTTQGVITISETGVSVISRNIENTLNRISNPNYAGFKAATFAIATETDRAYILFTINGLADTVATVAYRYNTFTQTWTSWEKNATCGLVNFANNKIYLGVSDIDVIEEERKNLSRRDYADRHYLKSFLNNSVIGNIVTISSSANVDVGDVIVQEQYLTISQFNSLLRQLDNDPTIRHPSIADYFSELLAVAGDDLDARLLVLLSKLLTRDPSGGYTYVSTASFATMQSQFNVGIIQKLNASTGAFYTNYDESTGTVSYEIRILKLNINNSQVTTDLMSPIMPGNALVYKSIPTEVIWSPNHFGAPELMKHIRESSLMFETTSLTGASFGFNSDLSANFEDISFLLDGSGVWGDNVWSEFVWGGEGKATPFRTYIPRSKQRCRFIRARFKNNNAFDKFAILGISFVFEVNSERGYRK